MIREVFRPEEEREREREEEVEGKGRRTLAVNGSMTTDASTGVAR